MRGDSPGPGKSGASAARAFKEGASGAGAPAHRQAEEGRRA